MTSDNIHYIIPARKGSKGLPFKNRKLLPYTLDTLPSSVFNRLTITTDDEVILKECAHRNLNYIVRPSSLSGDTVSPKAVMVHCVESLAINPDDIVVLLYLTYPQRSWAMIESIQKVFIDNNLKSLLCKKQPDTHPYLCFYDNEAGSPSQIISHDLYRRQDYPPCFELSFYACMFKARELPSLGNNMFNEDTFFFPLEDHLDIDTIEDFFKFKEANEFRKNNS
tara:strand:+ start:1041 stop:1709 length:669 start_codon:yes stop_codon:yes gene_type:complete